MKLKILVSLVTSVLIEVLGSRVISSLDDGFNYIDVIVILILSAVIYSLMSFIENKTSNLGKDKKHYVKNVRSLFGSKIKVRGKGSHLEDITAVNSEIDIE